MLCGHLECAAPTELVFYWMWLIYKCFAPNGAEDQRNLAKREMRPLVLPQCAALCSQEHWRMITSMALRLLLQWRAPRPCF